ncbi:restriction endonuclease subunit S [Chryseobacterium sp. OSA05B]|uniref:restriction endonuclease subunit S n=1 Tax=Chryseobacterium sp. OSA05B TaxID=2862650 RepID=UPI001CBB0942|nr:restriction endonuclease subunit S [Chryseobacterium sp. OSA05B]
MKLLEKHFEIALETPEGIARLRELILKLAMQGKLVEQNPNDQPANLLLEEIEKEKERLLKSKLMKKQSSLDTIKKEQIPYLIPSNWKWIKLENICTLITDGAHHTPNYIDDGVPFLSVKNLSSGKIDFDDTKFISEAEHLELTKRCKPEYNDILLTKIGTTGIAVTIDTDKQFSIFVSVALLKIISDKVYPKFIENLINSPLVKKYSKDGTEGVGNKNLVLRKIREYIIPLPPLEEQKRIVEKIDQLMLLCDKLEEERNRKNKLQLQINSAAINNLIKANDEISFNKAWSFITNQFDTLYTVKQNVTVLKDATLNLAIKGKLITKNVQNNEIDIISSKKHIVNEKDYPFSLPKGWKWLVLDDLGLTQTGTTPATKNSEYYGDYIPFIGPGDIKNQVINYTNLSLTELGLEKARLIPSYSIMMVCIGGSIGKLAINDRDVACNQQINTITPYSNIDLKYLFAVLQSSYFQNQIVSNSSGSATPIINKQKWISIPIPVPPYEVQKVISNKVDELFKLCDMLEKNIEQSSKKQSQILNSVLAQV